MEESKMIEQFVELLKMQKALDKYIMEVREITEYPESSIKVALFVELGELLNEFPTKFKHWKASAADNREKGLVEYVDALHFALSLFGEPKVDLVEMALNFSAINVYNNCSYIKWERLDVYLEAIVDDMSTDDYAGLLDNMFALGNELGFTWEEIYQAYKAKNTVNYERIKNGY